MIIHQGFDVIILISFITETFIIIDAFFEKKINLTKTAASSCRLLSWENEDTLCCNYHQVHFE